MAPVSSEVTLGQKPEEQKQEQEQEKEEEIEESKKDSNILPPIQPQGILKKAKNVNFEQLDRLQDDKYLHSQPDIEIKSNVSKIVENNYQDISASKSNLSNFVRTKEKNSVMSQMKWDDSFSSFESVDISEEEKKNAAEEFNEEKAFRNLESLQKRAKKILQFSVDEEQAD